MLARPAASHLRRFDNPWPQLAVDPVVIPPAYGLARVGFETFNGNGPISYVSGPNPNVPLLHDPTERGEVADPQYAARSATKMWLTTPLRALWQHPPYFHDGSAATLAAVVDRYQARLGFPLSTQQRTDLIEFLKSL